MANAWIPWYGCKKKSEGCKNCYIYRGAASRGLDASYIHKSDKYDLPLQKNKKGDVRSLDYNWVLDILEQCIRRGVNFSFRQTGSNFIKDGKMYKVQKRFQHSQARKADIDYHPE